MKRTISILAAIVSFQFSFCQSGSQILLTIDSNKISQDEFLRIYKKNSNIETGEQKSVTEYLDLFINYKLKVIEAEKLGYDTVTAFTKELSGYQDQLSKPYMENNELLDYYTKEAYQRLTKEVNVDHILIKLNKDAPPSDTLVAYNEAMLIRKRLLAGEPFDAIAKANSNDPTVKQNGGKLGWFTVFQMVYPFENASYQLPVGLISMPVRSNFGYHIIRVNGIRPNRGSVFVSHIMCSVMPNASDKEKLAAKEKIQKAYDELQNGTPWETVVTKYSDHRATISRGGKLGWVQAGIVPDDFLDTCFSIDSGKYSKPFATIYGYHIVLCGGRKPVPPFSAVKDDFEKKIKSNEAIEEILRKKLLEQIKNEYGFKIYSDNIKALYAVIDSNSLKTGSWNYKTAQNMTDPVISIGSRQYSQYDLAKFLSPKIFQNRGAKLSVSKDIWTNEYIDNSLMGYEEEQLPIKNPDLKNLLDEYHDGILLFNLTEDKVWKKAVEDSVGLKNFYTQSTIKYQWKPRIQLAKYTYNDTAQTASLLKLAKKRVKNGGSAKELSASLCPKDSLPCLTIKDLKYEKGENPIGDSMIWKAGTYKILKTGKHYVLYYVEKILPEQTKKFEEARGLYTADYQAYLEKLWIQELRKKYVIKVNNNVLENIQKEESEHKKI
jgi:peptidyl-prolyl cis-trans isomerase SurA